jgi:transposase
MQGKEPSKQETPKVTAGVDVSKAWLDAHVLPADEALRVPNTAVGIAQLKRWLIRHKVELVAVEATGKWHRLLCRSLHASRIPVAVTDPYRVRQFAKAQGIAAKTDRLDARVLAQFAMVMAPPVRPLTPQALEELQEFVTARQSAVAERTALKNQRSVAQSTFLKAQFTRRIDRLKADIRAIERECNKRIAADEHLARRFAILTSIPSIGPVIAITLIASLCELGSLGKKQIGALAGLAPVADDSGQRHGVRTIWGGRALIRTTLYLAAVTASRCNDDMKAFYNRLTLTKPPKVALLAIARKLVILANTLLAGDRLWQPTAPISA